MRHTGVGRSRSGVGWAIRKYNDVCLCLDKVLMFRPPKTSPYGQSVDMWSLGAVLFHLLKGLPREVHLDIEQDRGTRRQDLRTINDMATERDDPRVEQMYEEAGLRH